MRIAHFIFLSFTRRLFVNTHVSSFLIFCNKFCLYWLVLKLLVQYNRLRLFLTSFCILEFCVKFALRVLCQLWKPFKHTWTLLKYIAIHFSNKLKGTVGKIKINHKQNFSKIRCLTATQIFQNISRKSFHQTSDSRWCLARCNCLVAMSIFVKGPLM